MPSPFAGQDDAIGGLEVAVSGYSVEVDGAGGSSVRVRCDALDAGVGPQLDSCRERTRRVVRPSVTGTASDGRLV